MESLNIQGTVLTRASGEAYEAAIRRNSELSQLPAKYVVQPAVYEDIPPALAYAKSHGLEIADKGGGAHSSTWASTDGGVVIDMGKLNKVTLSEDRKSISVQGGAVWGDVYEVTSKEGVDVVGSPLWFVGVGGYTLGGGYGPLSGEHGLAIDNLLGATVVLADGRIVKTSANEEPDLFWAIRGGGGQFGIVVEFIFKTHTFAGPFGAGAIVHSGDNIQPVLKVLEEWVSSQTGGERITVQFGRTPPHFKPSVVLLPTVLHDTDGERSKTVLAPLREGAVKPVFEKFSTFPDMLAVSHVADAGLKAAPRRLVIRGAAFSDVYPELLLAAWERWVAFTEDNADVRSSAVLFDFTHPAKLAAIPLAETAHSKRVPHYWVAVQGRSTTDDSVPAAKEFAREVVQLVREKNVKLSGKDLGWILSMCQGDEKPEDVYGENLLRLREVKAKYDPEQLWSKGVAIEPLQK